MTSSKPSIVTPFHVQLLSNGRYSVMLTSSGGGYSRWRDLALTRWREDPTRDAWGSHVLLRDLGDGQVWSMGLLPVGVAPERYVVDFSEGRVAIVRDDEGMTTTLEVIVIADCDAELRHVTLENHGTRSRTIELTSYAELVLGSAAGDASHPAFSKMFVETEWVAESDVLLATRRRSSPGDPEFWAGHFAVVVDTDADVPVSTAGQYETDRARFLGRGHTLRDADAVAGTAGLSNTAGCVLDPVFSVRKRVRVAAGASVHLAFWTVAADSRDALLTHSRALRPTHIARAALAAASSHAQAMNAAIGVDATAAARYSGLVAPLLYSDTGWRAPALELDKGVGGAPTLWAAGISGDRPIVLLRIADEGGLATVDDLFLAQCYWQIRRLAVDVVVLDMASGGDSESLQARLQPVLDAQKKKLARPNDAAKVEAFVLRNEQVADVLRAGLATVARVVLDAATGLVRSAPPLGRANAGDHGKGRAHGALRSVVADATAAEPAALEFANGYGGFSTGAREYEVTLMGDRCTPAPWVNLIANPSFGFMVSCEGGGYSWSINSQQNALTPWPNDPVSDSPHDVLYVRDEDSGEYWSATALPVRVESAVYTAAHGKGYSRFSSDAHGIKLDLLQFVPIDDSLKLSRMRISNASGRTRRLSLVAYVEWALSANGVNAAPFVVTSLDATTGAMLARNAWRAEFGERVAFLDLAGAQTSATADRAEFLGVHGDVGHPAALVSGAALSARMGAGLDPCAALQTSIELAPDARVEILVMLGDAASETAARALIGKWRAADVGAALADVVDSWRDVLDAVVVRTPDRAMDIVLNDCLLYQTLGCRVWARTAYYQASGAYGFRDQLQDVMALCVARPDVARAQIVLSASRQFVEGDVQHWWLPPSGRGIRTRMTDDRVWLPYVAMHYIGVTGDSALFDEAVAFIDGDPLKDGQNDAFFLPTVSKQTASVYEHCARAIDVSLGLGPHDLPLFGTGDWNDGMNRVGEKGRGESIWLGWFLVTTIGLLVPYANVRGEKERIARWKSCAAKVHAALESAGWDGAWYRRGYYDDGTPLGSAQATECRIDQIAQSWSVMSGVADPVHATRAMASVDEHLIRHDDRVAPLLTPPFDVTPMDPGYIKGYPPGLRENGGQYTHGATWSVFAFAALGQGDKAAELFSILNPITHGGNAEEIARYKVEPYVTCGDVYSVAPLVGRGGWTWYSGSAGWLYRAGLEGVLGFRLRGDVLELDPVLPADWPGYELSYRRRGVDGQITRYQINVENLERAGCGVALAELDGHAVERDTPDSRGVSIALGDDGAAHHIRIVLG